MDQSQKPFSSRAEYFDSLEDLSLNPSAEATLGDIIGQRFSRRELLRGALGVAALGTLGALPKLSGVRAADAPAESAQVSFGFKEITHGVDGTHHVASGYDADVLIRWGDAVLSGAPTFDPHSQSAAGQLKQFGYNNDYIGYVPLPFGSQNPEHGLLCVNHEYTDEELMFPGLGSHDTAFSKASREIVDIEMACHGGSIIEVRKSGGKWRVVQDSRYARRISALDTRMRLSGPAAGYARLKTAADPTGSRVIGTINNCAGGITPWGTYLMAEENFHNYFLGNLDGNPEQASYRRYGIPGRRYAWGRYHERFDLDREPNAANLYGWVVEVDPLDPDSVPVKRTALGRFKHEGAESIVNKDGRLVVYSGDDQRFEFLYKFVSEDPVDLRDRTANRDLLDRGTPVSYTHLRAHET